MAGGKETLDRIQEAKEGEATRLDLSGMDLTTVPPELGQLTNLQVLPLHENPLSSPPPEVIAQGTAAIVAYLRSALEQGQREWVSKLLVVGEGGVGKTSLLEALLGNDFNPQQDKTHGLEVRGVDFSHPTARDVAMRLNAWDFGGQEIYHATHQFFLTNRSLFLLVWNARYGFEQGKLY